MLGSPKIFFMIVSISENWRKYFEKINKLEDDNLPTSVLFMSQSLKIPSVNIWWDSKLFSHLSYLWLPLFQLHNGEDRVEKFVIWIPFGYWLLPGKRYTFWPRVWKSLVPAQSLPMANWFACNCNWLQNCYRGRLRNVYGQVFG